MRLRLHPILILATATATLAGCSDYGRQERPPWRQQAEEACLAKGLVSESASIRPFHEISGPGICGAVHPFRVTALDGGSVTLNSTQTLDCPMIAALDAWVREVVQPAAQTRFGERVVRIDSMGSYNCRGINNMSGASLSEHSFANAIDVGGFVLESGRKLDVMKGFNGADEQDRAFLHEAHAGACPHFTTVLGPGYNVFHYNHFHLDLALHGSTARGPRRYCKPVPQPNLPGPPAKDNLPDPPAIEEEMDIARAPLPAPSYRAGPATLVASVPPNLPLPTRVAQRGVWPGEAGPGDEPVAAAGALSPVQRPHRTALALAPDPPPVSRSPAARPASGEPELISFGGAAPDAEDIRPEPTTRTVAARPPVLRLPGARAPAAASARGEARPDEPEAPPEAESAPRQGGPKDWDLTSSVGHRATR